jgi:hypothetical protein
MRNWRNSALAVVLLLATGCHYGPYVGRSYQGGAHEQRDTVVVLDKTLVEQISIDAEDAGREGNNLLWVQVDVRNRTKKPLNIELQTVFKAGGISTGDESAWKFLRLGALETQSYRITSNDDKPDLYTVRIRPAR